MNVAATMQVAHASSHIMEHGKLAVPAEVGTALQPADNTHIVLVQKLCIASLGSKRHAWLPAHVSKPCLQLPTAGVTVAQMSVL